MTTTIGSFAQKGKGAADARAFPRPERQERAVPTVESTHRPYNFS